MHLWVYLVDKPPNLTFELLISCLLLSLKLWSDFLAASWISCPFDKGLIPLLLGGNPFDINVRRSDTMYSLVIWVVIRQRFGFFFSFLFPRGMLEADGFSDSTFDIFLFTLMTWQITDDQFPFFSSLVRDSIFRGYLQDASLVWEGPHVSSQSYDYYIHDWISIAVITRIITFSELCLSCPVSFSFVMLYQFAYLMMRCDSCYSLVIAFSPLLC